jgi:hypothetical protein
MSTNGRPPDSVGGRLNFTPALFAGSYTLSLAASALATAKFVESFGQRLLLPQSPCDALWFLGPGFVAMSFVEFIPALRRECNRRLTRTGRPLLWVAGTAAVFGSMAGASITGIRVLADPGLVLVLTLLASITGVLAAVGWIFNCATRARPPDPDYDDRHGA